jgi:hypothetical protein
MKSLILSALLLPATLIAGPALSAPSEISIRDHNFDVVATISDPTEIRAVIDAIRRAAVLPLPIASAPFSHKLDLKGRWLYDEQSGRLMLLSKAEQPVYQLEETDRKFLEGLIRRIKTEPNK